MGKWIALFSTSNEMFSYIKLSVFIVSTMQWLWAAFSPVGADQMTPSAVAVCHQQMSTLSLPLQLERFWEMQSSFPGRTEHNFRQVNKITEAVTNDNSCPSPQVGKK